MNPLEIGRSAAGRLQEAWNAGDGDAYGSAFSPDSDFVTIRGEFHRGRQAIARGHQAIFDTIYAKSTVTYEVVDARALGDSVVLAHLRARLTVPHGPLAGESSALATAVLVDRGDGFLVTAFHNTLVAT